MLKFKIDEILDYTIAELQALVSNNFVDVIVDNKWTAKFPFAQLSDSLNNYKKINYMLSSLTKEYEDDEYDGEDIALEDLIAIYIKDLPYTEKIKEKLLNASLKFYHAALKMEKETEIM